MRRFGPGDDVVDPCSVVTLFLEDGGARPQQLPQRLAPLSPQVARRGRGGTGDLAPRRRPRRHVCLTE